MGQEFFINSQELEDKIRSLLPSQGGAGAGFDLTASTQIIPIIDLTESAEGSSVRQDLQTSLSLTNITAFSVAGSTTTVVNNTGYYRIFGNANTVGVGTIDIQVTDGVTTKIITSFIGVTGITQIIPFDFIVFLGAGESLQVKESTGATRCNGNTRQIADIDGNLVNPL